MAVFFHHACWRHDAPRAERDRVDGLQLLLHRRGGWPDGGSVRHGSCRDVSTSGGGAAAGRAAPAGGACGSVDGKVRYTVLSAGIRARLLPLDTRYPSAGRSV